MTVFADSSAVVKLYADELDSDQVRAVDALVISCLARVEVPAAIWRKHRIGELGAKAAGLLTAEFEADYFGDKRNERRFIVVDVTAAILDEAATAAASLGLRAYDAVQLATAVVVRDADPDCGTFACFDAQLSAALIAKGFGLLSRA